MNLATIVQAPFGASVYAALGELLAERSGVLNLGVEGMMLVGAVMGFWTVQRLHANTGLALAASIGVAALAGAAMATIHAFLVITLRASQIVSGLALTIFAGAAGLASYLGNDLNLADQPARHSFRNIDVFGLKDAPIVGPILFGQSVLVYISWACVVLVLLYLSRTRPGLNVRAVGESPAAADAMGINAFWRPELCLVGAYFFGALTALAPNLQARQITNAPHEIFDSLPYLMTVVVLVLVSNGWAKRRLGAPAALGLPYVREER